MHLTVYSRHVTYAFQSESALYNCLNIKELLTRSMRKRWHDKNLHSKVTWQGWHDKGAMTRTYSQMHRTSKYSEHSSIIWLVWLNGCAFVYKLSSSEFKSSCSHLRFRFCACFEQGVPSHSAKLHPKDVLRTSHLALYLMQKDVLYQHPEDVLYRRRLPVEIWRLEHVPI